MSHTVCVTIWVLCDYLDTWRILYFIKRKERGFDFAEDAYGEMIEWVRANKTFDRMPLLQAKVESRIQFDLQWDEHWEPVS